MNSSHAQISTILTRLTAQRALTNTNITTKTGARSITPLNVGYSDDSIMAIMYSLAGLTGAAGDLDAVLTLGNRSDITIEIMDNGVEGEFYTKHLYNGCQVIHNPSGAGTEYPVTFMGRVGGNNVLYLRDAFGFFGYMGSGTLTANRKVLLPDEGDGVGLDATLVLHTTADPITVTNGTSVGTYDEGVMSIDDGAGSISSVYPTYMGAQNTSGTVVNRLKAYPYYQEYNYTNSIGSVTNTAKLRFDRTFTGNDTSDIWFPNSTHDGDTLAVKGDITSMGNFATADLTFTGNRYHNVDRYNVDIDSANMFVIQDTNGKYALNINDTANYGNSLIYVSNRTDKTARVSPTTTFASRLFLQANSTQNLGQFFAGTARVAATQTSSNCLVGIEAGGGTTLTVDSVTKSVNITHLGGYTAAPTITTGTGSGTGGSPTATVGSGSTDLSGYFSITTGTTCDPNANVITMTYNTPYSTVPKCVMVTPANKEARNLAINQQPFASRVLQTASQLIFIANTTPLADATTYEFYYTVIQ